MNRPAVVDRCASEYSGAEHVPSMIGMKKHLAPIAALSAAAGAAVTLGTGTGSAASYDNIPRDMNARKSNDADADLSPRNHRLADADLPAPVITHSTRDRAGAVPH
ncbi:hypothetical protein [Streptomyces sp. NPDC057694]|uniref:hypothetical protein n=1 Tax=Streptomyces sp. NPDC057694 TaxID=3346216 RepID=UPI0036CDB9B4